MEETTLSVDEQGTLVLPERLREKYGLQAGDVLALFDLDGMLVLLPRTSRVPGLAREIERLRQEAGLSIDDLLQGLREQRQRYYQEHYAHEPSC